MTREEAIQYNKNLRTYMNITDKKSEYKFLEENYIALDMAIQALEQQPNRQIEDCENEIEDLHNRLDIVEYDKERLREEVTNLEAKIKALEQQPCENAISREMALDCDMSVRLNKSVLNKYPVGKYDYLSLRRACFHGIELAKHEMESYLIDLPPVTPQPKMGWWIKCDVLQEVKCSECRKCFRHKTKYCPECGAKMEVEE